MRKSLHIGAAFVGLIVGGGFASGQEIMQFFTSFGWYSILGGLAALVGFAFLGMNILQLGSELQTTSHKEVVFHIAGRRFGLIMDILITFFLFCITVAMFAGSASAFEQMFGVDRIIGSLFMMILTVITLMLDVKGIINLISIATPYLLVIILIIAGYSILTMDLSLSEQAILARQQSSAAPNWIMGALLYFSYNIAAGIAMLSVIGSTVKNKKVAGVGGIIGGVVLGILIILINIAMLAKMDVVSGKDMPILMIAIDIHPLVGIFMAITLLAMIYSTAVGMLYSFIVRIVSPTSFVYKTAVVFFGVVGFFASFIGFTTLVNKVYSAMGYLGFGIILAVLISWIKKRF